MTNASDEWKQVNSKVVIKYVSDGLSKQRLLYLITVLGNFKHDVLLDSNGFSCNSCVFCFFFLIQEKTKQAL